MREASAGIVLHSSIQCTRALGLLGVSRLTLVLLQDLEGFSIESKPPRGVSGHRDYIPKHRFTFLACEEVAGVLRLFCNWMLLLPLCPLRSTFEPFRLVTTTSSLVHMATRLLSFVPDTGSQRNGDRSGSTVARQTKRKCSQDLFFSYSRTIDCLFVRVPQRAPKISTTWTYRAGYHGGPSTAILT